MLTMLVSHVKRRCVRACVVPKEKDAICILAFVCRSVRRRASRLVTVSIARMIPSAANRENVKDSVWMAEKRVRLHRSAVKMAMNVTMIPIAASLVTRRKSCVAKLNMKSVVHRDSSASKMAAILPVTRCFGMI